MIYHVYANRSNIGDWLSAKGIQSLLGKREITECLCDEPFIEETIAVLSKATTEDLIVIGGGGLLMDYFTPFWEAFRPIAGRVSFCVWGIGYCDIKHEHSLPPNTLVEEVLRKSKCTIVRDELSRSHLPGIQLPTPVPCPSINIIEKVRQPGFDILHVNNYTTAGEAAYEAMCNSAKTFAAKEGLVYRETNNRITKNSEKELQQILSLYEKSGIILSSALHGCIIGVAMGLKVLAVSGDWKIDAFMEAVGLGEWVLDISELELIPGKLKQLNTQVFPADSLYEVKYENEKVAEQILKLYEQVQLPKNHAPTL